MQPTRYFMDVIGVVLCRAMAWQQTVGTKKSIEYTYYTKFILFHKC